MLRQFCAGRGVTRCFLSCDSIAVPFLAWVNRLTKGYVTARPVCVRSPRTCTASTARHGGNTAHVEARERVCVLRLIIPGDSVRTYWAWWLDQPAIRTPTVERLDTALDAITAGKIDKRGAKLSAKRIHNGASFIAYWMLLSRPRIRVLVAPCSNRPTNIVNTPRPIVGN
ncbi:hypothetical protein KM043_006317 [Ampulex compressa]|nr:hypothetical protein KM043_006317 [Ampulex compressa]